MLAAAACALVLGAGGAAAQHVVTGDTVRAQTFGGETWTGILLDVSPEVLQLMRIDTTSVDTLHVDAIRSLSVRADATQLSRAFEGGVVGLLGVLTTGLVLGTISCSGPDRGDMCGFGTFIYTVAATPFGIGIGAALGSKYGERRKWIRVPTPIAQDP